MHTAKRSPRPASANGSEEVNIILSRFISSRGKVPDPVGDLDPEAVVKAWTDHGEPVQDGWIIFDMAWL